MFRPIEGTWFEFQHHNTAEGLYYNDAMRAFTAAQWQNKLQEFSGIGMKYLVLLASAFNDEAYFPTDMYPAADIACKTPIETMLSEADRLGQRVFISLGFYGNWLQPYKNMVSRRVTRRAFQAMEQLYAQFHHHPSFYGWYLPDETAIIRRFPAAFVHYVNAYAAEARRLDPTKRILIAPYGTNMVRTTPSFLSQLESMDVDFVAYQDEVGVRKSTVEQTPAYFEALYKAHEKVGRSRLWADIELFDFEGPVYRSALIPAPIERIQKQIDAVSPFVETILAYSVQGIMNAPGSLSHCGHPSSTALYTDYKSLL